MRGPSRRSMRGFPEWSPPEGIAAVFPLYKPADIFGDLLRKIPYDRPPFNIQFPTAGAVNRYMKREHFL